LRLDCERRHNPIKVNPNHHFKEEWMNKSDTDYLIYICNETKLLEMVIPDNPRANSNSLNRQFCYADSNSYGGKARL
jgi:hypothetical protein